jgi:hypothetical protein
MTRITTMVPTPMYMNGVSRPKGGDGWGRSNSRYLMAKLSMNTSTSVRSRPPVRLKRCYPGEPSGDTWLAASIPPSSNSEVVVWPF